MEQKFWDNINYFKPSEFASKGAPESGVCMNQRFVELLDYIRKEWNEPLVINSGYRTKQHNQKVGGAENSPHRYGRAVDIKTFGWNTSKRERFAKLCKSVGMTGFGDSVTFVHIDNMTASEGFKRPLRWDYSSGKAGNYKKWI